MSLRPPQLVEVRHPGLLSRKNSRLIVVDVQVKLVPAIQNVAGTTLAIQQLIAGAQLLGVPMLATEQYPRGLGPTVPEIAAVVADRREKLRFSAAEALAFPPAGEATDDRHQIVLAGIETHVCVLQTALDLLALGYAVVIPADAVGSRRALDHQTALDRLCSAGAVITTTESILFEWCESAAAPEFKAVSALIKQRA